MKHYVKMAAYFEKVQHVTTIKEHKNIEAATN
jgi:hypothetical protein